MTFEERKTVAAAIITDFLARFAPPRGVPEDTLARIIADMADACARKMPICSEDEFRERLGSALRVVADSHRGYSWPAQAEIVDAIRAAAPGHSTGSAPETFDVDAAELAATRIKAGQPVDERFVWSTRCLGRAGVTASDLDRYRRAAVHAYQQTYRHDAHGKLRAQFGDVVDQYFGIQGMEAQGSR